MTIYVGYLSFRMDDKELEAVFSKFGVVKSAKVIMDRETGKSKGFGFIEMEDSAAGTKAIEALNGNENEGRTLRVNEAQPREERPRRQF